MPSLTDIPPELVASILRNLGDLRSLASALLACRYIHSSFKQIPDIAAAVVRCYMTPAILPYTVVALEASRLPLDHDRSSVRDLLSKLYDEPSKLQNHVSSMPLNLLIKMEWRNDLVQAFATEFATGAWALLREGDDSMPAAVALSPSEHLRFCRAFYRTDIFYSLFRAETINSSGAFEDDMYPYFFARHAPWENEQIGCVQDFLETRVEKASMDVVAHDVYFGELTISYLDAGMDNYYRQSWLSGGLEFIHQLISEASYDAKREMLNPNVARGRSNLPFALENVLQDYACDDIYVGDATKEELLSAISHQQTSEDTDEGPYECWCYGHEGLPIASTLMLIDNDWLRDRAYVFWDHERIETYHLMDKFEKSMSASGKSRPIPTDEEQDKMQRSMNERSKIWQKGGWGYWSEDDTSRIVWPHRN